MRKIPIIPILILTLILLKPVTLSAKPNDLTLNRLCFEPGQGCPDAQQRFRNLMREFGYAISPNNILPAETEGFGGGFFGVLGHLTFISNEEDYWREGVEEKGPDEVLFLYQVTSQFVFIPFFLEWGFTVGYLFTTSDTTIGFNVKLSPFEGFRKGALGALPDISFSFAMNRLIGDDEVSLTTGTAGVTISYAFAPGGVIVLTPFASLQFVGIAAESELVDLTPEINSYKQAGCPIHAGREGEFACRGDLSDYDMSMQKYEREWIYFVRVVYGIRLIYELLSISVQGSHGHQFVRNKGDPSSALGQLSFAVGLDF